MTVQVSEILSSPSPAGKAALCSAARTGSRRLPPGRGVQPGHAGAVGQPAPAGAAGEGQRDALLHPRDHVPARVQDRGDQVVAGEVAVEADDEPGEQLRPALHQPLQQRLLPGAGLAQDRPEHRPPGPGDQRDHSELRERRGPVRGAGRAEERPVHCVSARFTSIPSAPATASRPA